MKRIIFLIIGTLLVLGLVLPGCGTPTPPGPTDTRPVINIGIAGPYGMAQGKHHMYAAEMARDELNGTNFTTDGVSINGTLHKIALTLIDTNEVIDPTGADGLTAMNAKIGSVDFVLGGFRTEAVFVYRAPVMTAGKIFIDCGAATEELTHSVVDNYALYKSWFKATPPNEIFLNDLNAKVTGMIAASVKGAAANSTWTPRVALITEAAEWTKLSRGLLVYKLSGPGYYWLVNRTGNSGLQGLWTVSTVAEATEMNARLADMALAPVQPNWIITIMSGPCGVTFANRVRAYFPDAMVTGINVEAQRTGFPGASGGGCKNMVFLDIFPPGLNITPTTAAFVSAFVAKTGEYPIYTAGTYDAIKSLAATMTSAASKATATLIPAMEAWTYTGVGGKSAVYPKWDGATNGSHPYAPLNGFLGTTFPASTQALNSTQVLALYPWLATAKFSNGTAINNYTYIASQWTMLPHTTHDLVVGDDWVYAMCSQWQDPTNSGVPANFVKVGIWPKAWYTGLPTSRAAAIAAINGGAFPPATLAALQGAGIWDQRGWWNFNVSGVGTVNLTNWVGWLIATGQTNGTAYQNWG